MAPDVYNSFSTVFSSILGLNTPTLTFKIPMAIDIF